MKPSRRGSSRIITLTSDFGWGDGYVAAVKGVILSISPDASLIDISHELPPHDIPHAAFVLGASCPYFPPNTIHVAVVDPGVGTARRPLLLTTPEGTAYIAPDNGLLTYILMSQGAHRPASTSSTSARDTFMKPIQVAVPEGCTAYVLNQQKYWLKPLSDTFHGRDIFAPVAGRLSAGVTAEELGESVEKVVCLDVPSPLSQGDVIQGRIIHIDRFGNLVSNIKLGGVVEKSVELEIAGRRIRGLSRSYAGSNGLLAITGSHGYVEIAVRDGSAAQQLGAKVGARVKVVGVNSRLRQ